MEYASAEPLSGARFCSECGRSYAAEDLASFGTSVVCADCKPRFVQRMQEGALAPASVVYGGFWRRFLAVVLDAIILMVVMFPLQMIIGVIGAPQLRNGRPSIAGGVIAVTYLLSLTIQLIYYTYFISQKGATPGKMVMSLQVITVEGGRLSPGRAAARYFAQIVSGLILCIGYIIAAFDVQKRALHDYICSTRVIRRA